MSKGVGITKHSDSESLTLTRDLWRLTNIIAGKWRTKRGKRVPISNMSRASDRKQTNKKREMEERDVSIPEFYGENDGGWKRAWEEQRGGRI